MSDTTQNTDHNIIQNSNFRSNGDSVRVGNGASNTKIIRNWLEGGDDINIGPNAPSNKPQWTVVFDNKGQSINVRNGIETDILCNRGEHLLNLTIEAGAEDTNLRGNKFRDGTYTDNGIRTVRNGTSTNSGDPASTGEWNGNEALAYVDGVLVWDASTTPWSAHRADGNGNWTGT